MISQKSKLYIQHFVYFVFYFKRLASAFKDLIIKPEKKIKAVNRYKE